MEINDRIRYAISKFSRRSFSTTDLRNICSMPGLTAVLKIMAETKEIAHLGRVRRFKSWVDVWQELELNYDVKEYTSKKEKDQKRAELPGWREAYPFLFIDPKLEGKRSVIRRGDL